MLTSIRAISNGGGVLRRRISSTPTRLLGASNEVTGAAPPEGQIKPTFYVPRVERGGCGVRQVFSVDDQLGETRLERNDRRCPTRELNYTPEHWGKHKSPFRKLRHMINLFRSSPFQRLIFPDLFGVAAVATGLSYYNVYIAGSNPDVLLQISGTAWAGASTAIGLLAAFRLNASYGRYEECRIFWGDINNTIRDLAGQTMMWMQDEDQQSRMLKLCKAFPQTLVFHLHTKGCHHNILRIQPPEPSFEDRVHAEFQAELRDIYSDGKNEEDFRRLSDVKYGGGNAPLEVLTCMRETIAGSVGSVDAVYVRELDEQCQRLCAAFGASERVLRTPIPTGFTRHSSRLLFLWSHSLPFALYPAMGPIMTLPTSLLTAWAILSIEDLGVQASRIRLVHS